MILKTFVTFGVILISLSKTTWNTNAWQNHDLSREISLLNKYSINKEQDMFSSNIQPENISKNYGLLPESKLSRIRNMWIKIKNPNEHHITNTSADEIWIECKLVAGIVKDFSRNPMIAKLANFVGGMASIYDIQEQQVSKIRTSILHLLQDDLSYRDRIWALTFFSCLQHHRSTHSNTYIQDIQKGYFVSRGELELGNSERYVVNLPYIELTGKP